MLSFFPWGLRAGSRGVSAAFAAAILVLVCAVPLAVAQTDNSSAGEAVEPAEPAPENPSLSPAQEALAQTIFGELISPCCWTTTVATHGSGAAPRIQAEVRRMIAAGMGHDAIIDHYVQQYGERILAKPRRTGFNLAAYWIPYAAILVGAIVIVAIFRRRRPAMARGPARSVAGAYRPEIASALRPTTGTDEDYRRRLEEELRRSS